MREKGVPGGVTASIHAAITLQLGHHKARCESFTQQTRSSTDPDQSLLAARKVVTSAVAGYQIQLSTISAQLAARCFMRWIQHQQSHLRSCVHRQLQAKRRAFTDQGTPLHSTHAALAGWGHNAYPACTWSEPGRPPPWEQLHETRPGKGPLSHGGKAHNGQRRQVGGFP